jgi:hypothetical protein
MTALFPSTESINSPPMATTAEDDRCEPITLELPLHREAIAWLAKRSGGSDQRAAQIIAESILEIARDDEAAHATKH